MPHTNQGLIYSETRNGIKYGIDLQGDVNQVLGIGGGERRVCLFQHTWENQHVGALQAGALAHARMGLAQEVCSENGGRHDAVG